MNSNKKAMRRLLGAVGIAALAFGCAYAGPAVYAAETENTEVLETIESEQVTETENIGTLSTTHVCVHDPSIFADEDGTYYVFGSHTAIASSVDLAAWTQRNYDYGKSGNVICYGDLQETLSEPFLWAGYDDADSSGGYAVWAPDVIYNPYYQWEDGSKGAYMLYLCTSSTWRRSCIAYLVGHTVDGTYTYGDTIVYSGFTLTGEGDGSERSTKWDNDYLNLKALIEKGSENGGIDGISDNWFTGSGGWDNTYGPNAIDPNVFFDASGERLYMSYGSWSGGIYLLELDPTTGEALYPGTDGIDEVSGNVVDRYFGVHLMGGSHVSGEGPYIQYDSETGYYYLYVTYGALQAEGGYNMRLFRAENVTGPYLDAAGNDAADNVQRPDQYGIKLIGNYSFYDQIGKRSAGHNSMLIDAGGDRYLVYHQRFDVKPQLEAHEVRVHQQFLNEDDWPVTAVYEYRGETPEHYDLSDEAGTYEFVNHGSETDGEMITTQVVVLGEDGTVSGSAEGTWQVTASDRGYDYVMLELDDVIYKGFFFRQHKENADTEAVMTFSAIGVNNQCIWGSAVDSEDAQMMTSLVSTYLTATLPRAVSEDIELPTEVFGCTIVWSSSDPDIVSNEGTVTMPEQKTKVILTAQIISREISITQEYKMLVRPST